LASFYHDLGNGNLLQDRVIKEVSFSTSSNIQTASVGALQGVTRLANDSDNTHTKLSFGYQLIRTEKDEEDTSYSGIGHAGVGGSIGYWHQPTGLCIGVMLNKADGGQDVTKRILRVISDHYNI
jgi:hypothetical protein